MQGITRVPVGEKLAVLTERAERACETTAELVRDFNFIVSWYRSRPRSKLRAVPLIDETTPSDPLDSAGTLGPR